MTLYMLSLFAMGVGAIWSFSVGVSNFRKWWR